MTFGDRPALSRAAVTSLACAAVVLTVLSQPLSAATVRVGGSFYDIQFYGLGTSFADAEANQSPPIKTTPWWGNGTLAENLASGFLAQIGVGGSPFRDDSNRFSEIRFAFEENQTDDPATVTYAYLREADFPFEGIDPFTSTNVDDQSSGSNGAGSNSDDNATYAYAASVTPVPLPPAGLALGAALLGLLGLRRWNAVASRTA